MKEHTNANEAKIDTIKRTETWCMKAERLLKGKVIKQAQWQYWYADPEDRENWDEYETGIVLTLQDLETDLESVVYVSQDDEQNGPGALVVCYQKGKSKQEHTKQETLPVGVEDIEKHISNCKELGKQRHQIREEIRLENHK